jgi:hypothetical protein
MPGTGYSPISKHFGTLQGLHLFLPSFNAVLSTALGYDELQRREPRVLSMTRTRPV